MIVYQDLKINFIVEENNSYATSVLFWRATKKYSLLRHQNNKHKGSRNKIEAKKSYIKLSENEASNLEYRSIKCLYCEANFSCIQDQETHLVEKHKWEKGFRCNLCSKSFRKSR